jgi:CubicO group peptidase (beta-lactamase class C family)
MCVNIFRIKAVFFRNSGVKEIRVMKKAMVATAYILIALVLLAGPLAGCKFITGEETPWTRPGAFSYATPESQGMSADALEELADIVSTYLDEGRIVGAELMVLKNRYIVMHEVFGWRDRESDVSMEKNTLFNIRSMTKPITGAAAQLLIDRGQLRLDDRVADYLPGFDNDRSENITVEQLLTHRAGLPLTILTSVDEYGDLLTMANEVGRRGPEFPPGSKLWYSDAGTEALGGLVEAVSGQSLDSFVTENLLQPIGMTDTFYFTPASQDDPRRERIASLYIGGIDEWSRFWTPEEPLYPFAWGSQSLYGTTLDYARFLSIWLDSGLVNGKPVLSARAVSRTLEPVARLTSLGSDMPFPTGFYNLDIHYGQMSIVYTDRDSGKTVVIGHSGSDATHAWAWPEHDLIILYFTQSRGSTAGIILESEIDRLFIHPELEGTNARAKERNARYLGTYIANFGPFRNAEFEVTVLNGQLAVDIPNQLVFELEEPDEEGRWHFKLIDELAVSFEQDASGTVVKMKLHEAGEVFELPKGEAPEVAALDLSELQKYLGRYQTEEPDVVVEVVIQNGKLALDVPGQPIKMELYPPDEEGKWYIRLSPQVAIAFNESEDGEVESFTAYLPDGTTLLRHRLED